MMMVMIMSSLKKHFVFLVLLLSIASLARTQEHRHSYSDQDYEDEDEHLLAKIDCKIGDKYEYVLATQSSLFSEDKANLQMKAKVELLCKNKPRWLNKTSGVFQPAQLFEARIVTIRPTMLNGTRTAATSGGDHGTDKFASIKNGKLQMSALFTQLASMPSTTGIDGARRPNEPNLKVGAVNRFFEDLTNKIGLFFQDLFHKLVRWFEGLLRRKPANHFNGREAANAGWNNYNWNVKCSKKNRTEEGAAPKGRERRDTGNHRHDTPNFRYVNYKPVEDRLDALYRHPFEFVQLEDGSVQSVKLSELDTDPNVINFKKFVAHAFATQLDDRKRDVVESDHMGEYMSHYQMEYDEPLRARNADQYIKSMYGGGRDGRRARRDTPHMVSVVRSVRQKDIIKKNDDHYRNKLLCLADIDFSAQQVQLIEDNMLVASGGHFKSVFPFLTSTTRAGRAAGSSARARRHLPAATNESNHFDATLLNFMNLEMEYSMVKLRAKWKRSVEDEPRAVLPRHEQRLQSMLARLSAEAAADDDTLRRKAQAKFFRSKRDTTEPEDNSNFVCKEIDVDSKSNEIGAESVAPRSKECYEYKVFGSNIVKISVNKTIVSSALSSGGGRKGKALEGFATRYETMASLLGQELVVGKVEVGANGNRSRLTINFLGDEYLDLNLCEVRDRDFFHSNVIPLFSENIWFMTNVGIKIKYHLNFRFHVPDSVCRPQEPEVVVVDGSGGGGGGGDGGTKAEETTNETNFARLQSEQVELKQNTRLEFGGAFDASFLIFNGGMKLGGKFDMDNFVNFGESCLAAKSHVKPMKVWLDFNYKFFHPVCGEWVEDNWTPKRMSWALNKDLRSHWPQQACRAR